MDGFINRCFPVSLYPHYRDKDTSGHYFFAPLEDVYTTGNYLGAANRSLSCYTGDISSQIQQLCNKDRSEIAQNWKKYSMWFTAVAQSTTSSYYSGTSSTTYSLDRASYSIGKITTFEYANGERAEIRVD